MPAMKLFGTLADGREAIAARIHHAMADGIAGVRFLESVLFDARAESSEAIPVWCGLNKPTLIPVLPRRLPLGSHPLEGNACVGRRLALRLGWTGQRAAQGSRA